MRALLIALVFLLATVAAGAVEPDEILADPALEARARTISKLLRCLVCQNQSIDDSNAQLARDLRILVRRRLTAGDSDADAVAYIVARYGDFVLLRPPLKFATLALWLGPAAFLALAAGGLVFWYRRRTLPEPAVALSALERARLNKRLARRAKE